MANYRQIHTKIWKDGWFIDLSPKDKLLFIYLFSNERACLAGIYELPLRVIAFETGLSEDQVIEALDRFARAGKAFYQDGLIWIVNLIRYNAHSLTNPKIRGNIESSLQEIPNCPLKQSWIKHYNSLVPEEQELDTHSSDEDKVSIGYRQVILHEQEQEQEQEQDTNDAADAAASPPINLNGWLKFVREEPNRAAAVRYMIDQLYPYLAEDELPEYGRIGATAKRVSGWGRLVQLVWRANQYEPQGDLMSYIEQMAKGKRGDNGKNQRDSRARGGRRYTADDIPEYSEEDLAEFSEEERRWILTGEGEPPDDE